MTYYDSKKKVIVLFTKIIYIQVKEEKLQFGKFRIMEYVVISCKIKK